MLQLVVFLDSICYIVIQSSGKVVTNWFKMVWRSSKLVFSSCYWEECEEGRRAAEGRNRGGGGALFLLGQTRLVSRSLQLFFNGFRAVRSSLLHVRCLLLSLIQGFQKLFLANSSLIWLSSLLHPCLRVWFSAPEARIHHSAVLRGLRSFLTDCCHERLVWFEFDLVFWGFLSYFFPFSFSFFCVNMSGRNTFTKPRLVPNNTGTFLLCAKGNFL